jgi:inosine-uridine nucleoside N-ribohydrolase
VRLWIDTDVGDNPDDAVALLAAGAACTTAALASRG